MPSSLPPLTTPPALPLQVDEQLGGDSTSASLATHDLSPDGWRSVVERLGWWSADDGETSEALHRQVKRAQALLAEARREGSARKLEMDRRQTESVRREALLQKSRDELAQSSAQGEREAAELGAGLR